MEELQPFACKELITPNPHVVVQARCLELATIGVAVGASLVNYRAGTPSYTSSEGPARLLYCSLASTPRGCYGLAPRAAMALCRKRQAKATKCNPATVSGKRS